ncbi:unnamed protein product [Brassica rapa]|uniref:Uncharacterized protein n=1 Tax=Brassica campestris TaxID=3711 RepID=A0A3P6BDF9_BRACM|nr:unnamed protein product [Brassica rapa]VDD03273.1 unnamed protein product [Brassica rapa]
MNLEGRRESIYEVDLHDQHPELSEPSFTRRYDETYSPHKEKAKSRLDQAFTEIRKIAANLGGKIDLRLDSPLAQIAIAKEGRRTSSRKN